MHVLAYKKTEKKKVVSDTFHVKFYSDDYPNDTKVAQILSCEDVYFAPIKILFQIRTLC